MSGSSAFGIGGGANSPSTDLEPAIEEQLELAIEEQLELLLDDNEADEDTSRPRSRAKLKDIETEEDTGQRSSADEEVELEEATEVDRLAGPRADNEEVTVDRPPGDGFDNATVVEADILLLEEIEDPPTREG